MNFIGGVTWTLETAYTVPPQLHPTDVVVPFSSVRVVHGGNDLAARVQAWYLQNIHVSWITRMPVGHEVSASIAPRGAIRVQCGAGMEHGVVVTLRYEFSSFVGAVARDTPVLSMRPDAANALHHAVYFAHAHAPIP
jgi:hypothetical protein